MPAVASIFCVLAAAASGVEVTVHVVPPVVPFYKQPRLVIAVEGPGAPDVQFSALEGRLGGLTVYAGPEIETSRAPGGRFRAVQTTVLDAVGPGEYLLDPVSVTVNGEPTAPVPVPAIHVRGLTSGEEKELEKFAPNAGLLPVRTGILRRAWFWAMAVASVLVLMAALRFRRSRPTREQLPQAPPWEIARARLRGLEARQWARSGLFEPFHFELSDILRQYIENRFRIRAPEQTTPEFLSVARGLFEAHHEELLARFLRTCDRVKFARHEPSMQQMQQAFDDALRFVEETVPASSLQEARA